MTASLYFAYNVHTTHRRSIYTQISILPNNYSETGLSGVPATAIRVGQLQFLFFHLHFTVQPFTFSYLGHTHLQKLILKFLSPFANYVGRYTYYILLRRP